MILDNEEEKNKDSIKNIKHNCLIKRNEIKHFNYCSKNNISKYEALLKYYNNKNILKDIKDQQFLSQLINELDSLIDSDYGKTLLPFLSPPCHELLDAYIKSDLDEEESIRDFENLQYIKIFEKLKKNIFISKETVSLIYSYFGSLFYDAKEIEQNDKRLSKFLKVKELWKIFNKLPEEFEKNNKSSINFIGGKLVYKFKSIKEYDLNHYNINIKINFLSNNNLNDNLEKINFLKINGNNIDIKNDLKNIIDINNLSYLEFNILMRKIEITCKTDKETETFKRITNDVKINSITLLENYYGQVQLITTYVKNKSLAEKSKCYLHYPLPTTDQDSLCNIQMINKDKDNEKKITNSFDLTSEEDLYELKIDNNKLIKVNYINYIEDNFNIIENLGGIVQFLPFMSLIKNLYENKKIELINNINKKDILIDFVNEIISTFINIIFHYDEYKIKIEKYNLFFFSIIAELDPILFSKNEIIFQKINDFDDIKKNYPLLIEFFSKILKNETIDKSLLENLIKFNEKMNEKLFSNYECFYRQLYTKLTKELFIYNRSWSIFDNINKEDSTITVKYKQLSYYTKSFQQPFMYPILEMDKYYPPFTNFDKKELFRESNKKILNYDFSLSGNNIITSAIEQYVSKYPYFEKCCLVKKIYHVKGKVGVVKNIEDNNESFEIIFKSNNNEVEYACNKDIKIGNVGDKNIFETELREKNRYVCYGSLFQCPKKEYNRIIKIKSDEICFLLIREYFHRVSGIEIFTINGKSYFFNFNQKFQIEKKLSLFMSRFKRKKSNSNMNENDSEEENDENNDEDNNNKEKEKEIEIEKNLLKEFKNVILSNINLNEFRFIIVQDKLMGYYNKKYRKYFFPLFNKKKLSQILYPLKPQDKNKYLSNYDILVYINLLSNRSFKDLYQYPVFPMFYQNINKTRIMNKHIGFQNLDEMSNQRIQIINDSYRTAKEDYEDDPKSSVVPHLFNTHYSNPIYTSNYLIRVFPYTFSSIELQGDGFDNPNRLFYSVDGSMNNTLSQKSDLRELIPELFYFFEIFKNKNDLKFNKLTNDKEIDTVLIQSKREENDTHIYKFLADMRNILEKEEQLNDWIDLMFGVKQEKDESKREYYDRNSYVNYQNKEEILNNEICMESTDFGVVPYKIFNSKFPSIKRDNTDKLELYNYLMIDNDHFVNNSNPMKCCMCIGRIYIDKDYLKFYENKKLSDNYTLIKKLKEINEFCFYFIGDIFGNVTIYQLHPNSYKKEQSILKKMQKVPDLIKNITKKTKNSEGMDLNIQNNNSDKINTNINNDKKEKEKEKDIKKEDDDDKILLDNYEFAKIDGISDDNLCRYTVFKKLYDHKKQIKYIDFNGRLNLFITYSLDEYINIYFFPSCKLFKAIKVSQYVEKNNTFNKVILISTPFPMIFCSNDLDIYIFDINFNLIHSEPINDSNKQFKLHIDKNCGIVQDYLSINGNKYKFPFIEPVNQTNNNLNDLVN